jgi:zinc transport system substrate-binding protein
MKKTIAILLSVIFVVLSVSSCATQKVSDKKSIVVTVFPEYDWVMNVIGDLSEEYEVNLLLKNGSDLHSYQPSTKDMASISSCDLFIYVGGESDFWVEKALENPMNKNRTVINLMKILGSRAIEEEGEEGEEPEYDEHVWLSLKNAVLFSKHICTELSRIDDKNTKKYLENTANYLSKLTELDEQYSKVVNESSFNTLIVADRFPFAYLCKDYNIQYYAAFDGCSADTEASFETVIFLADKLDESGLNCVLKIESSDDSLPTTIINNSKNKNRKIFTLNSIQSVTMKDIESGTTYLSLMQSNLDILRDALN